MTQSVYIASCLAILLAGLVGCAPTHVRVLNVETGEPVAGATLIPYIRGMLGDGHEMETVVTGNDGRATISFPRDGKVENVFVRRPMIQVRPSDKPSVDHGEMLLYVAPWTRVVFVVPHGYSGPIPVVYGKRQREKEAEPIYRVVVGANDPLQPVQVRYGDDSPELFEAERDGVRLKQGTGDMDPSTEAVWTCAATYYQTADHWPDADSESDKCGGLVTFLYIGTLPEFRAFDQGLRCPNDVDRQSVLKLQAAAVAAGRGVEMKCK